MRFATWTWILMAVMFTGQAVARDSVPTRESMELRTLRDFETRTFPRSHLQDLPRFESDEEALPLPSGLSGRWGGTGDIPSFLRSQDRKESGSLPPARAEWLRGLKLPELPIRWEPQVIKYLEFFKDDPRGRGIMSYWLRRMGRFRTLIERTLDQEGLPKDLVFLAMVESGFDPGAVSPKAAGGIWQFIPSAARAYGLEVSHWVDARRDPERATEAAIRYLKDLHVRFGTWPLAFAAYNAGYGAILRSIARFNTNDFWELCRHESGLPWETTLYVPKIMAAAVIGHNLEAFGFANLMPDGPFLFDRIEVPAGTSFAGLARTVGTQPEVLAELNPEYIRKRVPPDRERVTLRVPVGTGLQYSKAGSGSRDERLETITLRFGESLEDVAKARGLSVRELRRMNGVSDSAEVRGGTTILAPPLATVPSAPLPETEEPILVAIPDRSFSYEGRERVFYRTREGDTLGEIAGVFDVPPDEVAEWNHLDPEAKLQPKLILQLYVREGFDRRGVMLLDADKIRLVTLGSEEFSQLETASRGKTRLFYSPRPGDTLAKIAKRYGLSPGDLARINRLSANSELTEGQKIVVYSPTSEMPKEITPKAQGKKGFLTSPKSKTLATKPGVPRMPSTTGRAATNQPAVKKLAANGKESGKQGLQTRTLTTTAKPGSTPFKKAGNGKR